MSARTEHAPHRERFYEFYLESGLPSLMTFESCHYRGEEGRAKGSARKWTTTYLWP